MKKKLAKVWLILVAAVSIAALIPVAIDAYHANAPVFITLTVEAVVIIVSLMAVNAIWGNDKKGD